MSFSTLDGVRKKRCGVNQNNNKFAKRNNVLLLNHLLGGKRKEDIFVF